MSANVPFSVECRVRNGIRKLEAYGPADWRQRINLKDLDVQLPGNCVLGQIYGHYEIGLAALMIWEPYQYGFSDLLVNSIPSDFDNRYAVLTEAWRQALAA